MVKLDATRDTHDASKAMLASQATSGISAPDATLESLNPAGKKKAKKEPITILSSLWALWRRILVFNVAAIIFVPLGILSHLLKWGDIATFVLNVFAIIPLAKVLDFSTDELSKRVGETLGGLMNATFGNAVELIVGVLALTHGELEVVQGSLIGSVLSNLLLVLGFCFVCGGLFPKDRSVPLNQRYQTFSMDQVGVNTGLLALVFLGFIIPAAFHIANPEAADKTVTISRLTAIILLLMYCLFIYTQISNSSSHVERVDIGKDEEAIEQAVVAVVEESAEEVMDLVEPEVSHHHVTVKEDENGKDEDDDDDEDDEPETLAFISVLALLAATVIIGICAEFLVSSLDGLATDAGISKTFVGVVLLPIVGNAAEHVTAVSAAMRDKMDLVISVAIGSSIQISLLVAPFLVLVGWMIGQPLTLDFHVFESTVLFVSIFTVSTLISDGKTNYLEGALLLAAYLIIAIAFFYVV
ncbi:Sodium/calcium exchanger protein-domain-containing protein [Chytriomyces sp. MP71]|nr:Sodium/calcium exchanger protein-domain-containing protein [Chytriomyces sp. MP71]